MNYDLILFSRLPTFRRRYRINKELAQKLYIKYKWGKMGKKGKEYCTKHIKLIYE